MARIPLLGGAYRQASLIAGAQRAFNVYPEMNPERAQGPVQYTHYSRPGLTALGAPPTPGRGRGVYVTSLGDLYAVVDQAVYFVNSDFQFTQVGSMVMAGSTPVQATDNGQTAFLVDGSLTGGEIKLVTRTFSQITDPNFLGATRADFLDSFCIFNQPNTPNWYSTESNSSTFNALFFGTKTAWPDDVQTIIASERQAWVMGKYKSEVWANAGTFPFPFQLLSGNIIEYGVVGPYAIGRADIEIYWLSQSPEGTRTAVRGVGLQAQRMSTHAIEHEWLTYPRVDDCIVTTYQLRGHIFVHFDFPTADRTWVWDRATEEWHEEGWLDSNGVQHRTHDLFKAYAYGMVIGQDWATGQIYQRDENNFTDNGAALVYKRGLPHILDGNNFNRLTLWRIIADMECGTGTVGFGNPWSSGFNLGFGPIIANSPAVVLRISRNRGFSFETHSIQTLGVPGGYNTKPTFNRCGTAYDFVVELNWGGPIRTALNGVFAVIEDHPGDE